MKMSEVAYYKKTEKNYTDENLQMIGSNKLVQFETKGLTADRTGYHEKNQIILRSAPEHRGLNKVGNKSEINKNLNGKFGIVKNHQQR